MLDVLRTSRCEPQLLSLVAAASPQALSNSTSPFVLHPTVVKGEWLWPYHFFSLEILTPPPEQNEKRLLFLPSFPWPLHPGLEERAWLPCSFCGQCRTSYETAGLQRSPVRKVVGSEECVLQAASLVRNRFASRGKWNSEIIMNWDRSAGFGPVLQYYLSLTFLRINH